ncbi:hypothetical protein CSB37_03935 [bacterium DOLZORAL124_38_8]|nr:MAG: hypothetical protein CSB37_03935 [bacterium DOLZORAL124_38_8]
MKKKCWLVVLIFIFGTLSNITLAKTPNLVQKVLENTYFFDSHQTALPIHGITIPTRNNKLWCHHLATHKFLQTKIKGSTITKITPETFFLDSVDVRTILLANGVATVDEKNLDEPMMKKLFPFQKKAYKEKLNIWKRNCNDKRENLIIPAKDRFSATVGVVTKVFDGHSFKFKKGPIIQILNTSIPKFTNHSPAAQCFRAESKKFLEHQILGKVVQLEKKDIQGTNPAVRIFRNVRILEPKPFESDNLAEILIKNGYAQYIPRKFLEHKAWGKLQKHVYQNPTGAWSTCSPYVFGETNPPLPKETPTIPKTCPIKGNISGSKKHPIKTYHTIKSGWYKRIKAERCFSSEAEAQEAGFRKVK